MCSGDLKVLLFFIAVTCFNTYYGQDVRLVGDGSFTNMGRLEVSVNNTWYAVCSFKRYYGDDTTAALRSNLGCKKLRRIYYSWFGVGNETKCLNNFYCSSRSAISSCTFSLIECCSSSVRAYFCDQGLEIANSSIRLVGGSNISGRVEVQIQDVWGSVETDGWNYHAARLVCRSQDLPWRAAMIVKNGLYGRTLGKSWMTDTECTGSENNLFQCWFNLQGEKQTFSNNAGVICADSIPVRLVDGDTPTSGRVEVYIDGKWGSVLSYIIEKDMTAKAICNILGTPSSSTKAFYVESGFYRKSSSITWLVKLYCSSDASSLYQCSWAISGYFSKSNNFGVVCQDINEFSIRLVNNQTANRGYVEVFLGGLWGTITHTRPYRHYTWGKGAATVACRQLGLPHSVSLPVRSSMFGSIYSLNWIESTYCLGSEQSLLDCIKMGSVSYYSSYKAGVICTDTDSVHYRLASNTSAGRVEIQIDGKWGGINKKAWNEKSASLFCKHLQKPFSRALPVVNDVYGFSHWEWLTQVSCYGTEINLIDCPNVVTGQYGTGSAGVVCTDYAEFRVRLNNGSTAGRVEVYLDGEWGGIDASTWTHSTANIVCNQIGLKGKTGLAVNNTLYGVTPTLTWIKVKDSCSSDAQILSCNVEVLGNKFFPRIEAGVICADVAENVLEIYNGSWYGTVRFFLENEWGTLDADGWGQEEATVACKQLGFSSRKALAVQSEFFGYLDYRVWIKDFKCTGNELNILQCPLSINGFSDYRIKDAGLICQDRESFMVRLVGNTTSQGVVEVFLADRWGTIDPTHWENNAAKSVCRHLQKPSRFGFAVKSSIFHQENSHQWLSTANCDGNEPTLFDCKLLVSGIMETSQAASVICSDSPKVSLVGGNSTKTGLIEFTIEGEKGYIPPVGQNEAKVICRQLGFTTNVAYFEGSKAFPSKYARRWASSISCTGTEESVFDCSLIIDGTFKTEQYAYLSCEDSFTLSVIDGLAQHQGTLRLSLGNLNGYIHQENSIHWRRQEATVACRQLGFPTFKAFAYNHFGRKTGWRLISSVSCLGNERVIGQCAMNYGQGEVVSTEFQGVICTGMDDYAVRVSDGQYDRGRVEVSVGGTWGSVSSSSVWSSGKNAQVICTQLGFQSGVAITNGTYLRGSGPVWIRDLNCAGHERSIRDCSFTINGTDLYSRSSSPDVGVILNQKFTRVTSSTKNSKSSQTSQENVPTTETVLKPKNTTEGNEETSDETDKEEEIINDNTGLFVGISVAALSVAIFIVLVICWKLRSTIKKDASLSADDRKETNINKGQQSSNDVEETSQKNFHVQSQVNPACIQDYSPERCSHNNCNPGSDLIQFPDQDRYSKLQWPWISLTSTVRTSSSYDSASQVLHCESTCFKSGSMTTGDAQKENVV